MRLIPPAYVKPFVKRRKNDLADAEAIAEAAQRPTMRFVAVKSEDSQAAGVIFRTRDLLVRQRTQLINALRGHLGEFGLVVPQESWQAARLISMLADPDAPIPRAARSALRALVSALERLEVVIHRLETEITRQAKDNEVARRLMTIPGAGPLIATALVALAPPPQTFQRGRDFAVWLGLTPRQHSTGGKQRLGATTRMGERSLRRLLIIGVNSVVIKRHVHKETRPGTWLAGQSTLAQAANAGPSGTREQDGADRLGVDGKGRSLQSSGRGGISRRGREGVGAREGQKQVWRNGREAGSEDPGRNKVLSSTRR